MEELILLSTTASLSCEPTKFNSIILQRYWQYNQFYFVRGCESWTLWMTEDLINQTRLFSPTKTPIQQKEASKMSIDMEDHLFIFSLGRQEVNCGLPGKLLVHKNLHQTHRNQLINVVLGFSTALRAWASWERD